MVSGAPVNADPTQCAIVDTNKIPWQPTAQQGVAIKVLERVNDPVKGRETALFKLDPGTKLPTETLKERLEIFILEGKPRRRAWRLRRAHLDPQLSRNHPHTFFATGLRVLREAPRAHLP
jgi:hypothetical protein